MSSLGGVALGNALQSNKTLKELNVSSNAIDAVACLTLCAAVLVNESLEHVVFDGMMVMMIMMVVVMMVVMMMIVMMM